MKSDICEVVSDAIGSASIHLKANCVGSVSQVEQILVDKLNSLERQTCRYVSKDCMIDHNAERRAGSIAVHGLKPINRQQE